MVSYILLSSSLIYMSAFDREMCAYCNNASAAPFVGQSCLESQSISLSRRITSFCTIYSVIVSLSTLHVRLSTIPIIRSRNLFKQTLFGEFFGTTRCKACSNSTIIRSKRSLSLIKWATFSIQPSFAVKSRRTVAAGYFIWIRSFQGCMNRSTISMILPRYF